MNPRQMPQFHPVTTMQWSQIVRPFDARMSCGSWLHCMLPGWPENQSPSLDLLSLNAAVTSWSGIWFIAKESLPGKWCCCVTSMLPILRMETVWEFCLESVAGQCDQHLPVGQLALLSILPSLWSIAGSLSVWVCGRVHTTRSSINMICGQFVLQTDNCVWHILVWCQEQQRCIREQSNLQQISAEWASESGFYWIISLWKIKWIAVWWIKESPLVGKGDFTTPAERVSWFLGFSRRKRRKNRPVHFFRRQEFSLSV